MDACLILGGPIHYSFAYPNRERTCWLAKRTVPDSPSSSPAWGTRSVLWRSLRGSNAGMPAQSLAI
jgi:hypothetical protein